MAVTITHTAASTVPANVARALARFTSVFDIAAKGGGSEGGGRAAAARDGGTQLPAPGCCDSRQYAIMRRGSRREPCQPGAVDG